jgi:NAD(P)-dependent dehydrogenase (short-subunit alcohol dehydrogenase family)
MTLSDQASIVLVTGACRGSGRGTAIALGAHGCTAYGTDRSGASGDHPLPATIYETADAVTQAGGKGIAVACDHADDAHVAALFAQIGAEQGRQDVLVNNAAAVHDEPTQPGNFWEKSLKLADMIDVGIRISYVASWYAARIMVAQDKALIVFTSASGCAKSKVAAVSICMGAVLTERLKMVIASDREKYGMLEDISENPGFTGTIAWALFNDPAVMEKAGKTFIGAELARECAVTDQGRQPPSYRATRGAAPFAYIPTVIR